VAFDIFAAEIKEWLYQAKRGMDVDIFMAKPLKITKSQKKVNYINIGYRRN